MRILHTSDWHLGKQLNNFSLTEDQSYVLEQIHEQIKGLNLDCIVISGDIYDRSIPPPDAVTLFDETITRLSKDFGKPVFIIPGNHDSAERLNFGSSLFGQAKIFVSTRVNGGCKPFFVSDRFGEVAVCAVPYLDPAVARDCFGNSDIHTHEAAIREANQALRKGLNGTKRSVLIGHAFVSGGQVSESERPLSVGGTDAISAEVFDGFNYVALGHLHKAQMISAPHIRYSGSLLKYSQSEVSHRKSASIIDLDADGKVSVEELFLTPERDLREVSGCLDDFLTGKIDAGNRNDLVVVKLLDTGHLFDASGRLRAVFPNLLNIERPEQEVGGDLSHKGIDKNKSDLEIFKDFAKQMKGANDEEFSEDHERFFVETLENLKQSGEEN